MEQQLQAIATILSLVNPVICGAMFTRIEAGQTPAGRLADATTATLAVLVILVVAALVGTSFHAACGTLNDENGVELV